MDFRVVYSKGVGPALDLTFAVNENVTNIDEANEMYQNKDKWINRHFISAERVKRLS